MHPGGCCGLRPRAADEAQVHKIVPDAELWRQMGVFGAAVDVPETAPLQHRLLGLTGRHPR